MKQAYMSAPGVIQYRDVPDPVPGPGEVVIRVARIGICGSDLHVFRGKHPLVSFPLVQGHEFSGYVEATGDGVTAVGKGQLVTVQPATAPSSSIKKRMGLIPQAEDMKFIGGALPGAGSELFRVHEEYVVPLPQGISADDAAMVEPLAVAVHAVRKAREPMIESRVVFGAGTIGNLTGQVARAYGASRVLIVDKNEFRLGLAESAGLTPVLIQEDGKNFLDELLRGKSADVCFECVGHESALNDAIRVVKRGGTIVVVGVYEGRPKTDMVFVQDKEIDLRGALMYSWEDYATAVQLLAERRVSLAALRTHHVPFDRWIEGYRLLIDHPDKALKVMVDL